MTAVRATLACEPLIRIDEANDMRPAGNSPKTLSRGKLFMCGPEGRAGVGFAVKGEALCARAAEAARPLTALTPAPDDGHTHEDRHAVFDGIEPA